MSSVRNIAGEHGDAWAVSILNDAGEFWRFDTHVFEAYASADYASYLLAADEAGVSGLFQYTVDPALPANQIYQDVPWLLAALTPIEGQDEPQPPRSFGWSGTNVVDLGSVPPPAGPSQTSGYLTTRDGQGNAVPNVTLYFQLCDANASIDEWSRDQFSATSDDSGLLVVTLQKRGTYRARSTASGAWSAPFTVGRGSISQLPEILAAPSPN